MVIDWSKQVRGRRCVKYAFILLYAIVDFDIPRNFSVHVYGPFKTLTRSILILSSHLCPGLPSGLFPSGFPTENLYVHFVSLIQATRPAHLIRLGFDRWNNILCGVESMKPLVISFSTLLSPRLSSAQISFSGPYARTPSNSDPSSV
jgi:hypothetical protein